MEFLPAALLVIAGFLAGAVNAVAGGGSLIAFAALIGVGLPPLTAKFTNTVAAFPGNVASVAGGYRDLPARREALRLLPAALLGGVVGAVLLLRTPTHVFDLIVPFLVLAATALFALQGRLASRVVRSGARAGKRGRGAARAAGRRHRLLPHTLAAGAGLYGGYLGAGAGIVLVAILAFLQDEPVARTVAAKNLLAAAVSLVAVVLFVLFGRVDVTAVAILVPAAVVGGYGGARLVRRLPERLVEWSIVGFGTAFGLALLWQVIR